MNEAIVYCITKTLEAQGHRIKHIKPITLRIDTYRAYNSNGETGLATIDVTLDLAWWAEVPIDDEEEYLQELSLLADANTIGKGQFGNFSMQSKHLLNLINAPIPLRCQALYESEVGK